MTRLLFETEFMSTQFDAAAVAAPPNPWPWVLPYLTDKKAHATSITPEDALELSSDSTVPDVLLPKWARVVDDEVYYFLRSYAMKDVLETCLQIISSILKPIPKAKIRHVDGNDNDTEYLSISLVPTKNNVDDMADYIYNCNVAMSRSLPAKALQYIVITME